MSAVSERPTMNPELKAAVERLREVCAAYDDDGESGGDSMDRLYDNLRLVLDALEQAQKNREAARADAARADVNALEAEARGYRAGVEACIQLLESECEDSAADWLGILLPSQG